MRPPRRKQGLVDLLLLMTLIVLIATSMMVTKAWGHDPYSHWKTPEGLSCCMQKDYRAGTGDCYPAEALMVGQGRDTYYVVKLDTGQWVKVPDDRIIREKNPDPSGVSAHVCEQRGRILCFVPSFGGG